MFKWLAVFLCVAVVGTCLVGLGVGPTVLGLLLLSLSLMLFVALLIAWPFLRKRPLS